LLTDAIARDTKAIAAAIDRAIKAIGKQAPNSAA
jgi:hypothetical protein